MNSGPGCCLRRSLAAGCFAAWATLASGQAGAPEAPGLTVSARIGVLGGYNDNVTLQPDATLGSRFLAWTPTLTVDLPKGEDHYALKLRAELTRYAALSASNTDNLEASAEGLNLLGPATAAAWRLTLQDWHDPVGGSTLDRSDAEPDHFRAQAAGAVLRHEPQGGRQRWEGEFAISHKAYVNHREVTVAGDLRTYSLTARQLTLMAPQTRWLWEARAVRARYAYAPQALDQRDFRLLAGLQWDAEGEAAPPFSGSARLGLQRKLFDRLRPGHAGATWELQGRWQLTPAAAIDLSGGRAAIDAPGDGADQILQTQGQFAWSLTAAPGLVVTLSLTRVISRFEYQASQDRRDGLTALDAGLRWAFSRSTRAGLSWSLAKRHSSAPGNNFGRHIATLSVEADL